MLIYNSTRAKTPIGGFVLRRIRMKKKYGKALKDVLERTGLAAAFFQETPDMADVLQISVDERVGDSSSPSGELRGPEAP